MRRIVWRMLRPTPCIFPQTRRQLAFYATTASVDLPVPPPVLTEKRNSNAVSLRNYQEDCIKAVLSALKEGRRQVGISLATGSGKTVIFTHLIERVEPSSQNATQTLILVHRRELVEQAARHCRSVYPNKTIDVEMGNLQASGIADITIASVQSINSGNRIEKFDPARYKLILVDEAHHIVARGYLRVLDHFGLVDINDSNTLKPALVGVSATFSRLDGLALGKVIKYIVYHKDYIDMIGEKWLSNAIFTTVQSRADISRVKKGPTGDFQTGSLSKAVNTTETNAITVRAWLARANDRKSTLVFCVDLEHIDSLCTMFRQHGIDARFITGDTPSKIRGERLDAFRNREFPVLLNCGVFTEGTDIPNIDCILLARPTKSRNLLVQMIGRGMRLFPGKTDCHVIDMVASLETGIVTTPTLFGLDPFEMVEGADVNNMQKIQERRAEEQRRQQEVSSSPSSLEPSISNAILNSSITFTDYDSVADLIEDSSGERHIRAISPHAWVQVSESRYILKNTNGNYLCIEEITDDENTPKKLQPVDDHARYTVKYMIKLPSRPSDPSSSPSPRRKSTAFYARPRIIATAQTFEAAVHAADTYASHSFPHIVIATHPSSGWRSRPASAAQVKFLNRFRGPNAQLAEGDVSMGKAGDMITKIQFGARGRFAEVEKGKGRRQRKEKKARSWEEQKARERVKVGPLAAD